MQDGAARAVMNVNSVLVIHCTKFYDLKLCKIIHFLSVLIGAARAVSKEILDFALITNNALQFHLQVSNDKAGIEQFIKQAKKQNKPFSFTNSLFCMEHTARAAPRDLQ